MTIQQEAFGPSLRIPTEIPCEHAGHTPHFQSLVSHLLQRAWECGLFPDMTKEDLKLIAVLSAYHDVGKVMFPPPLLDKPGPLSQNEFELLKTHPLWGEYLVDFALPPLQGSTAHRYACEICRWHHERWDGGGYPDGLSGTEIPRYIQVVGLADAYDALVTSRSYRPPMPHSKAANMIVGGECGIFWPPLLDVFETQLFSIRQEIYGAAEEPSAR